MPSKKASEFYAEDIPNLNGYVVIVTGGKFTCTHFRILQS